MTFKPNQIPGVDCCITCGETKELSRIPMAPEGSDLYCKKHFNEVIAWGKKSRMKKEPAPQESPRQTAILDKRFQKNTLLKDIFLELDKDHKLDNKEKLALFIIRASAELPRSEDHCTAAIKGDSSTGKDNIIKTVLKHYPPEDNLFLTRGTQSALEEEAKRVKCVAFSEINKHREDGANKDITEFFKQLCEGGVDVVRRDMVHKEDIRHITTPQKTLFYGTTETESDDELETRFIIIPVKGSLEKNQIVVQATLDQAARPRPLKNAESWIVQSIRALDHKKDVLIPYAPGLTKVFDLGKERVKRDVKRLLSLTKAITWLHQQQRMTVEEAGEEYLVADPTDFQTALELFREFMNATYEGFDHRYSTILEAIHKHEGKDDGIIISANFPDKYYGWAVREEVWRESGINRNTFKDRVAWLRNEGYVESFFDRAISSQIGLLKVGAEVGGRWVVGRWDNNDTHSATTHHPPTTPTDIYKERIFEPINLDFLAERRHILALAPTCTPPRWNDPGIRDKEGGLRDEDILKIIMLWKKQKGNFIPIETLAKYPIHDFDSWLEKQLREGVIFKPRPDVVGVL